MCNPATDSLFASYGIFDCLTMIAFRDNIISRLPIIGLPTQESVAMIFFKVSSTRFGVADLGYE